jgi:hypothetical protein
MLETRYYVHCQIHLLNEHVAYDYQMDLAIRTWAPGFSDWGPVGPLGGGNGGHLGPFVPRIGGPLGPLGSVIGGRFRPLGAILLGSGPPAVTLFQTINFCRRGNCLYVTPSKTGHQVGPSGSTFRTSGCPCISVLT